MLTKGEVLSEVMGFDGTPEPAGEGERIKALFVEDNGSYAQAFGRALGRYAIDCVTVTTLAAARRLLQQLHETIHVVLLDLHLPDGRGEDLLPDIEALSRQPGIVILSSFLDEVRPETVSYRTMLTPKTITPSSLALIIHQAAHGYAYRTISRFAKHFALSPKETEVLGLVGVGISPKQTAGLQGCSVQTIYARLARIAEKTGCASYQEVVAKLFRFSCHDLGHAVRPATGQ